MTLTKRALTLALTALMALAFMAGPAAAQTPPVQEVPSDLTEHYSGGDVTGFELMAMTYDINDQLLGERWRTMGSLSWAINSCVTNPTRFPDFGSDSETRTEVCTAYQKGYLYPRAEYDGGSFYWDGDDALTRYDLAAYYYRWGYFFNAHNAPASSNNYFRVGSDAPAGGARLHDLPFNASSGPPVTDGIGDYALDLYEDTIGDHIHRLTPETEVNQGIARAFHPANRTLDPWSPAYPWQKFTEYPNTPIGHLNFAGKFNATGEAAASMLRRSFCAGQSLKNQLPTIHYSVGAGCFEALWDSDNQGHAHRYVESPINSDNWVLDASSYWRGYGFDRPGTNDFGWASNGDFNNIPG